MKVTNITPVGKRKVYDISVQDAEHYVLENGVVTHNTGPYYAANNIWFIGRQQDKDGTTVQGYHFIINIEKSRFVKEKSKIPISVSWEGGIEKWSGLLQVALDAGYVIKPKNGWYTAWDPETKTALSGNLREDATMTESFWMNIFEKTDFENFIREKYTIGLVDMINSNEDETEEPADEDTD